MQALALPEFCAKGTDTWIRQSYAVGQGLITYQIFVHMEIRGACAPTLPVAGNATTHKYIYTYTHTTHMI